MLRKQPAYSQPFASHALQPKRNCFDIVAIGASASGVEAVSELVSLLPHDLAAAVLVVLHRDPERTSSLLSILTRRAKLNVVVPRHGDRLDYGTCFIGTPEEHLTIGPDLQVHLVPDHFYRSHNVDALFNSLARNAGSRTSRSRKCLMFSRAMKRSIAAPCFSPHRHNTVPTFHDGRGPEPLADIERHIADGNERIERQCSRVSALERNGHNGLAQAWTLLDGMRESQRLFQKYRQQVMVELDRNRL